MCVCVCVCRSKEITLIVTVYTIRRLRPYLLSVSDAYSEACRKPFHHMRGWVEDALI